MEKNNTQKIELEIDYNKLAKSIIMCQEEIEKAKNKQKMHVFG